MLKYKKIFLIFLFLYICNQLNAQNLNVIITDSSVLKPFHLYLSLYKDGVLTISDSIFVQNLNKNNLIFSVGNYQGYCELKLNNKIIPFIYNYKEKDFILKLNTVDAINGIFEFKNSSENIKDNQLSRVKQNADTILKEIRVTYLKRNRFDSFSINKTLLFERNYEALMNQKNILCDSIIKSDTFLFTKLIANFIKTPTAIDNPILKKHFDNYEAVLHWHYFDFLDFSNPLILNHPYYKAKIDDYFYSHCDKATIKDGIDLLMSKAALNTHVKEVTLNYLIDFFLKRNQDELIEYLNDKYTEGCGIKLDAEKLKEFSGIVQTQIGQKIPDIITYDAKNNLTSLYSHIPKSKYTVIYIWMSSCHACQTKTPKLAEIFMPYYKKGLNVFSISIDDKKDTWLGSILKYKIENWINISELVSLQNSSILPKLNVRATPKLFIVDNNGIIVAKDIFEDKLKEKLSELFK